MIFIKDLEWADKLTPTFRDNLEDFLPRWLESLIPYYKEGKEKGVDIFHVVNFGPNGCEKDGDMYEHNGIAYYYHKYPGQPSELGFNSKVEYRPCNWLECFCKEYGYNTASSENLDNSRWYDCYMWRLYNTKPDYSIVADRADTYFKEITGDPNVCFSLSSTSLIYYDSTLKRFVDDYYRHN